MGSGQWVGLGGTGKGRAAQGKTREGMEGVGLSGCGLLYLGNDDLMSASGN